jgi:hypothetical protein
LPISRYRDPVIGRCRSSPLDFYVEYGLQVRTLPAMTGRNPKIRAAF